MNRPNPSVRARFRLAYLLVTVLVAAIGALSYAAFARSGPEKTQAHRAKTPTSAPFLVSSVCNRDVARRTACNEALLFLRASDLDQVELACSQFTKEFLNRPEVGGLRGCMRQMSQTAGERIAYGILDARPLGKAVQVLYAVRPRGESSRTSGLAGDSSAERRFVMTLVPQGAALRIATVIQFQ